MTTNELPETCSTCYHKNKYCIVKDKSLITENFCPFKRLYLQGENFLLIQDGIKPDTKDLTIAQTTITNYNNIPSIRIGDYIKINETYYTISHIWKDENIITSVQFSSGGSIHISENGHTSFSGSLNPGINPKHIEPTTETKNAFFWFFHHSYQQASNGITLQFPTKVYKYIGKDQPTIF